MRRGVVDAATVAAALAHLETLPDAGGALRTAPLDRDPFLASIAALPGVVALARDALGTPPIAFGATYVVKPPRVGLPARWHQDGHPWEARGILRAVTVGIALDRATEENGCLQVIPGSHTMPAQPLRPVLDPPNVFAAEIDPALVDELLAVSLLLEPGDCSVHLPNLIHGSGPNRSATPRRTLVVRYRT